ncbi:MAG: hypothetical protein ACR65O_15675 [Methylomicrobium sp.]
MELRKVRGVLSIFFLLCLIKAGEVKSTVELVANGTAGEPSPASENKPTISTPINQTPIDNKPIDATPIKNDALDIDLMRKEVQRSDYKGQKRRWVELHGSLNKQYVYLIVEKTGKRDVAGYLFDGKGNHSYVYGEWFNGQLQIYDQSNKSLTIMLHD